MIFAYRKLFDANRSRAGGIPRIGQMSLQCFGSYHVFRDSERADAESLRGMDGYTLTENPNEGIQDLLSYGFEEMQKYRFEDVQEVEVDLFRRNIASDLRSLTSTIANVLHQETSIQAVQESDPQTLARLQERLSFNPGAALQISTIGELISAALALVRGVCAQIRKHSSINISPNGELATRRPVIGHRHVIRGIYPHELICPTTRLSLESFLSMGEPVRLNCGTVKVDDTPLARRYLRYLRHLSDKHTPLRLGVREIEDNPPRLEVLVFQENLQDLDQDFEQLRPFMPEGSCENPTVQQKALMILMLAANKSPVPVITFPDELFVNPEVEPIMARANGYFTALYVNLTSRQVVPNIPSIMEAAWSLNRLSTTILQSTSLNFPELTRFTANA